MKNHSINNVQGGWSLGCLALTKVNLEENLDFMKLVNIPREEAVLYLTREKDEDALLDFITTSFVFPDNETENEKEGPDVGSDKESLDAEDDEDEEEEDEGKEFVAKVSVNLFYLNWWWDLHEVAAVFGKQK